MKKTPKTSLGIELIIYCLFIVINQCLNYMNGSFNEKKMEKNGNKNPVLLLNHKRVIILYYIYCCY